MSSDRLAFSSSFVDSYAGYAHDVCSPPTLVSSSPFSNPPSLWS